MPMLIGGHWREALSGRTEEITTAADWESAVSQANGRPWASDNAYPGP